MPSSPCRVLVALLSLLAVAGLQAGRAEAGLLGYWSFDGCTTTHASGNHANLTAFANPVCSAGAFGSAWRLNGSSQYLDRDGTGAFTPGTRAWSVAAWVNTSSNAGTQVIVEWYRCGANPGCNASDGADYILGLVNGQPYWDVRDDNITDLAVQDSTRNLADGAWHLLVGTLNPATGSTRLYVDGGLSRLAHGTISSLSSGGVAIPLEVGRHFRTGWGEPGLYFDGAIDEVRIYDQELTAGEVTSLFAHNSTTGVPGDPSASFSIEGAGPNPSRGGPLVVAFTLPASSPAQLALYDIGGRLIAGVPLSSFGAGHHEVELLDGRNIAPGVYLVHLRQGGRSRTRRVTLLQ